MSVRAAIALAIVASSCVGDQGAAVDFRIVHAPGDEPYAGADTLLVALERGPSTIALFERRSPVSATTGDLPVIADGDGYRYRVDVLAGSIVFARGRSYPFSVRDGSAPASRPDVLLGTLGTFASPVPEAPLGTVAAVAPADGGAILATDDGALHRYRAHTHDDAHDGEASIEAIAHLADRAGARWASLEGGLILALGGARAGASVHDASGRTLAVIENEALSSQHHGAAVAPLVETRSVLVLGGAPRPGDPPTDRVTRLDVEEDEGGAFAIRVVVLPPLAAARLGGSAVATPVHDPDGDCPCARVVVFGGTDGVSHLRTAELIDPDGLDPQVALDVGDALDGAAAIAVDTGFVLIAGGRGPDGIPVSSTRALDVQPGALRAVSPEPPALLVPRSDAVAVRFDVGLVLVAGGRGVDGAPLASAEIYDFELARFGEAASTSALPVPDGSPRGATLADGSVLVAGEAGPFVYFPPRGGGL